ncbi:MAG: helix-turn-helix transcriptional regulator [Actinomycetota bacterium]|nr:helix-turn-helix transcriptional regulator [Actinomycetota bacterium]
MDAEDARAIGARARMIRRRRGLSLEVAAGLAGITKTYLSMLELGQRGFNRRGLIEDLADALTCSVADLTGRPSRVTDRDTAKALATVPHISLAINDCTLDDVPDMPARPVEQLAAAAAQANAYLDAAQFSLAGQCLGALLSELHIHAVTGDSDTRRVALAALAEACLVGASVARHLGHTDLAVKTAQRGYDAAQRLDDSTRAGLLTMHHSLGLAWIGARHRVTTVLDEALAQITPDPSAADTGPAQAAGMMHLTAAMHHARQERAGQADDHLGHAEELARRTGERNALLQHFGPVNVVTWGVNVAVELGRGPVVAARIEPDVPRLLDTFGSPVRGGALHFDLARAYAQADGARDAEAIRHLDAADRLAPQYVRPDPIARDLVVTLVRRATRRLWELDSLRNRFGIGGQGPRKVDS